MTALCVAVPLLLVGKTVDLGEKNNNKRSEDALVSRKETTARRQTTLRNSYKMLRPYWPVPLPVASYPSRTSECGIATDEVPLRSVRCYRPDLSLPFRGMARQLALYGGDVHIFQAIILRSDSGDRTARHFRIPLHCGGKKATKDFQADVSASDSASEIRFYPCLSPMARSWQPHSATGRVFTSSPSTP